MANARVYEVAKTLNITSKHIIDWFSESQSAVRSASSVLTQEQEQAVRTAFSTAEGVVGAFKMRPGSQEFDRIANERVLGACLCCGIEGLPVPRANVPEDLPVQKPKICLVCSKHLGDDAHTAKRREEDHIKMRLSQD